MTGSYWLALLINDKQLGISFSDCSIVVSTSAPLKVLESFWIPSFHLRNVKKPGTDPVFVVGSQEFPVASSAPHSSAWHFALWPGNLLTRQHHVELFCCLQQLGISVALARSMTSMTSMMIYGHLLEAVLRIQQFSQPMSTQRNHVETPRFLRNGSVAKRNFISFGRGCRVNGGVQLMVSGDSSPPRSFSSQCVGPGLLGESSVGTPRSTGDLKISSAL